MRLLIVEDDEGLSAFLQEGLSEEGFDVARARDGDAGLALALSQPFDCIVLDVMLPGRDGIALCRRLRDHGRTTPVLMLTVKAGTADKVKGLSAGADDYLVKPFAFAELLARIHACIRRSTEYADPLLRYGDLLLDPLSRTGRRAGRTFELTPMECSLLEYLLRNAERTIATQELLERVWEGRLHAKTNVVNVYLHHLRKKVDHGFDVPLLHTIAGQGFRLGDGSS